jgi:hypothetical protein
MEIRYLAPFRAAYARMRSALFRPFSFERWMYFGFASWMAGWGAHDSFSSLALRNRINTANLATTWADLVDTWGDLWADPAWRGLILLVAFLLLVLGVVSVWVQSRGEFVFLESAARDRLAIWAPWREYAREGNSLFLWRLAFHAIVLAYVGSLAFLVWRYSLGGEIPLSMLDVQWLPLFAIVLLLWLPGAVLAAVIFVLLRQFVTPIMYRDHVRTNEAWRRFRPLLRAHAADFFLYLLFYVGLLILSAILVLLGVCVTCCILGCLLAIPFLGTVLYLPISYTFRALGPEFLAQFPSEPPVLSPLVAAPQPPSPETP